MSGSKQIANLRDQLTALENTPSPQPLTEANPITTGIAKYGGKAVQGIKNLFKPTLKSDARAALEINGKPVEFRLENGIWKKLDRSGNLKVASTAEAEAAEAKALADVRQHATATSSQHAAPTSPTPAAPAAAAASPSILRSVLSRFGIGNNSEAATKVMFHKTQIGKVVFGGALGIGAPGFYEAITETPPNMKKLVLFGLETLAGALGVGINPLGLAVAGAAYYLWAQDPLTEEEKQNLDKIADEYIKSGKTPDPKTDQRISDPKLLKGFKAVYELKKKSTGTTPAAGTTTQTSAASSQATPTSSTPSAAQATPAAAAAQATPAAAAAQSPTQTASNPASSEPPPTKAASTTNDAEELRAMLKAAGM
jgi:hypothetical protein